MDGWNTHLPLKGEDDLFFFPRKIPEKKWETNHQPAVFFNFLEKFIQKSPTKKQ